MEGASEHRGDDSILVYTSELFRDCFDLVQRGKGSRKLIPSSKAIPDTERCALERAVITISRVNNVAVPAIRFLILRLSRLEYRRDAL